ncbi:class I adenylate-forming enzyme family protein [Bradyrhizobium liaoningense]
MDPATIVRRGAGMYRCNTAVSFEGRRQSYGELYDRACRLANVVRACGAMPGDRVAALGDNAFETVEQAAACALANTPRVTLYTYQSATVNRYLLELTKARVLIVQSKYAEDLVPLLVGLTELRAVLVFGEGRRPTGTMAYEEAMTSADAKDPNVPVAPEDVHIIRFSSGTTGKPKGIFHTIARWAHYNNEWAWVTPMLTERSRYLVPTSLAHLGIALLWNCLAVGACIIPVRAFDARNVLDLLETMKVTHAVAAPVMIRDMVRDPSSHQRDFSSLQCLMYAGSPIASDTLHAAIEVFGQSLFQLYAQSEAMPATMLLPHQHVSHGSEEEIRRLRSVGRATPNMLITVRDEFGSILPVGEVGEIAVRGPSTMSGIWGDPTATAQRTLADGSILTRDMGYIDNDGFVYLVDRKDDMIVSGGFNIWPSELEQTLLTHPAVSEVCVFGVPDERWGETPMAAVVLREGMRATEEELVAHTRSKVGGVKKVTRVIFLASLPRTATGKIQRNMLKEPYWAKLDTRIAGT